jgi:hypothetical protein
MPPDRESQCGCSSAWKFSKKLFTWTAFVQLTLIKLADMKDIPNSLLRHLMKPGRNPKGLPPEILLFWTARPRNPLMECHDDLANMFIEALVTGEAVTFIYMGGSQPGSTRSVKVSLVFQHDPKGRVYVSGYCLERAANRVFSLDLIMVIHAWN